MTHLLKAKHRSPTKFEAPSGSALVARINRSWWSSSSLDHLPCAETQILAISTGNNLHAYRSATHKAGGDCQSRQS